MKKEKTLTLLSPAKINLTLDVLGIDPAPANTQGYHFVDTVMHEIGLADELTFTLLDEDKIIIESDNPTLPTGEKNTIFKAIKLLEPLRKAKKQQSARGIKVEIKKNIPLSSGLGGGSSNAATALKALNQLWQLKLFPSRLRLLAAKIGMDAPFFIEGGTAHCTHYGEKVQILPTVKLPPHLIVMDDEKSSTKEMYEGLSAAPPPLSKMLSKRQHLLDTFSINTSSCRNAFDVHQSQKNRALQKKLLQLGATVVHTCGSGPALYALFESEMIKRKVYKELKGHVRFIWQNQNKN